MTKYISENWWRRNAKGPGEIFRTDRFLLCAGNEVLSEKYVPKYSVYKWEWKYY